MTVPDVPQDIVGMVIDACQDDTDALKTCALVSPSWTFPCQRHLFRSLTLGGFFKVVRFRHQDPIERDKPHLQQFREFYDFLENSPNIASQCIRFVKLDFFSHYASPASYSPETNEVIFSILSKLNRVHALDLQLGRWERYNVQCRYSICALLQQPSISNISIGFCEFYSASDLTSLLVRASGLKHLAIRHLIIDRFDRLFTEHPETPETTNPTIVHLECLRIDGPGRLLPYMLHPTFPIKFDKLRRLRVRLTHKIDSCESVKQLFGKCGVSLQHLELVDSLMYIDMPDKILQLDQVSQLRSLRFFDFKADELFSSVHWIVKLFTGLTTYIPLVEVEINLIAYRKMLPGDGATSVDDGAVGQELLGDPCRELDALLTRAELHCLQRVKIVIVLKVSEVREPEQDSLRNFEVQIRKSFPALTALSSDILKIEVI